MTLNLFGGLRFDQPENIRDGHALHRIVRVVTSGMEGGLKINSANGRMPDGEFDDLADLMFIDAPFDRGDDA